MDQSLRVMDQTELSLGPTPSNLGDQKSPELDHANIKRKRKQVWDETHLRQSGIELQLSDPLSLDWEQYLDLQSGRMYYMNRRTLKKSWMMPPPKEQEDLLDLNLNISPTFAASEEKSNSPNYYTEQQPRRNSSYHAVVCINCHLLVMLCKSSPSCPNCKYVHSPLLPSPPPPELESASVKTPSSKTLSLLH